jgi:hypothetical protein
MLPGRNRQNQPVDDRGPRGVRVSSPDLPPAETETREHGAEGENTANGSDIKKGDTASAVRGCQKAVSRDVIVSHHAPRASGPVGEAHLLFPEDKECGRDRHRGDARGQVTSVLNPEPEH